jgi:hypothetical protein
MKSIITIITNLTSAMLYLALLGGSQDEPERFDALASLLLVLSEIILTLNLIPSIH